MPPHVSGFPAKVVEQEIDWDPAEEESLVNQALIESPVIVLRSAILKLLVSGIGKQATYSKCNGDIYLYH
jgi:hypothetical protein